MSTVILDMSVSLDGFLSAANPTPDAPLGVGGERLPTGDERLPTFVITHTPPADSPAGSVYTFVTGGVGDAVEQAGAVAGDRTVSVGYGADIARQLLAETPSILQRPCTFATGWSPARSDPPHRGPDVGARTARVQAWRAS